jgi:tetratricopeptide (TPR) repeat protein
MIKPPPTVEPALVTPSWRHWLSLLVKTANTAEPQPSAPSKKSVTAASIAPSKAELLASMSVKPASPPLKSTSYNELVRADAYRYCRRWKEAQAIYRSVLERPHLELGTAQTAQAWVGNLLCWEQLAGAAIATEKAVQALQVCPLDASLLWESARLGKEAGHWRLVAKSLKRLTRLQPTHTEAWFELALACELMEQWPEAEKAYKQVLTLEPDCLAAGHNLANVALRLEKLDEAKQGFKALLNQSPGFAKAQLGLALCLDKQGNARQAVF